MSYDPNQSPESIDTSGGSAGEDPQLDAAAQMLRQTKPWVRLISVMTFVGSAFMVLSGGFLLLASIAGLAGGPGGPGGAELGIPLNGSGAVIGVIYIVMSFLYILPAVYLWRYANRIGSFDLERSPRALASALEAQKSFWRFCGIVIVVYLVIVFAMVGFVVIAGIVGVVA